MFFRRATPKVPTFQDRVDTLKSKGFTATAQPGGNLRIARGNCAVDIGEGQNGIAWHGRAGILMGEEIGALVDGGYQKFFLTPGGVKKPATAEELVDLHNLEEDLKEALGEKSLYNESLGTV